MEFNLTKSDLLEAIPSSLRSNVTDEFIKKVNDSISGDIHRKHIADNVIGYAHILREGKYKITDYINAVKYCSFKMAGYDNIDAYRETFPDRWLKFMNEGTSRKTIHSYVAMYNKGTLVQRILEMAMIPVWLNNQDVLQEAINTQAQLMRTANSEKVRSDAANSIMTHVKPPDPRKGTLDININNPAQDDVLTDLREAAEALRAAQREALTQGVTIDQVASTEIVKPPKDIN